MTAQSDGLRGIVVGESEISEVLAEGKLSYRGYSISDLAEKATFEEVIYLLWFGTLPTSAQLSSFTGELNSARDIPIPLLTMLNEFPITANSMDSLRTAISALGMYDPDSGDNSPEANHRKAIRIQAKIPTVVAAIDRLTRGLAPVPPKSNLSLPANFLYMLRGTEPDELSTRTIDIDFILHADHELNASTFSTRVTVATHADIYSGMVSGIGTLSGPRHGAAAQETMDMLEEIGTLENVDAWVRPKLTGEKRTPIPGFGHPVYRAPDPRSAHLREMSRQLSLKKGDTRYYYMTEAIEKIVDELSNTPERLAAGKQGIYPNVDCFSATCYHAMDLPTRLFTPMFAISRTSGWIAHMMEQFKPGQRIIRPRADYVGNHDLPWVSIQER